MEFINCTPHALTVINTDGQSVTFTPSGIVPRCSTERGNPVAVGGFTVTQQKIGAVAGMPAPADGVTYIVSALVLAALSGSRDDVVAPDTGPSAIRENGQIVAVRGFVK